MPKTTVTFLHFSKKFCISTLLYITWCVGSIICNFIGIFSDPNFATT